MARLCAQGALTGELRLLRIVLRLRVAALSAEICRAVEPGSAVRSGRPREDFESVEQERQKRVWPAAAEQPSSF